MIIRRFTDTLDEQRPLEAGTKAAAQEEQGQKDASVPHPATTAQDPFDEVNFVRDALSNCCKEFFESLQKEQSSRLFFRKHRESTEGKVERKIRLSGLDDLDDFRAVVDGFGDEWKKRHGKASSNFHSVCKTLDAHKTVFTWFPSSNEYMSVFSGALKMVLQASIYHEEIAEYLSDAVASLCEKAALCTELLSIIKTDRMKKELAEVYKKLFVFLWEAAKWFTKPAYRRLLNSFNQAILKERKAAEDGIISAISKIRQMGEQEGLRWTSDIKDTTHDVNDRLKEMGSAFQSMEAKVDECRAESRCTQQQLLAMGRNMLHLLEQNFRKMDWEAQVQHQSYTRLMAKQLLEAVPVEMPGESSDEGDDGQGLSRTDVDAHCRKLDKFIHGTDGIALAEEGRILLADPIIVDRLGSWAANAATRSQKLWLEFPFELQEDTSARMAALGIILTAAQADAPFISYIPKRPNEADIPRGQCVEDAGLLSVVFSLIRQLLRFRPKDDSFKLQSDTVEQLDGSIKCWKTALSLLGDLLRHTTSLRYCILHGMNEFESEDSEGMCSELVKLLVDHSGKGKFPFSILFTTSGQSRILYDFIPWDDRARTEISMRAIERRGKVFESPMLS
ncbi:hypothetical protein SLS58_001890 [Diplodia intermedia]|uniref:DUF7708 domain-containing protein n=1 Tax=Diplodia intermedia TaxID=856260 RepID=A0ABR3U037_9PEZI